jgi:hypothetical protein
MTDFLVSTSDAVSFHAENLKTNPSHYPLWARIAGPRTVASVQETMGAEIWYVAMVNIKGLVSVIHLIGQKTRWHDQSCEPIRARVDGRKSSTG